MGISDGSSDVFSSDLAMLGALVILFAGYLLAKLIEQGTERLLHRIRLNQALERGGVMDAVERGAAHFTPTKVIVKPPSWILLFAVIMVAEIVSAWCWERGCQYVAISVLAPYSK